MIFDDPLPTIWEKYFSEYNQETQAEENWLESDLYKLEECFFPEWDSLYALPWGEQTIPDYDDIMPYLYTIESYWKWLNVYYREDPILSYSYAKNRFYKIQNDNRIRNQMIQDSNATYHLSLTP